MIATKEPRITITSCTDCDDVGQGTAIIKWRLDHDSTIRESFYSTDGDLTNRFFLQVPTQALYRGLIVSEHGELHAAHPDRYKRFIRSGDDSHTALQTPLFYLGAANDVPLYEWVDDFANAKTSAIATGAAADTMITMMMTTTSETPGSTLLRTLCRYRCFPRRCQRGDMQQRAPETGLFFVQQPEPVVFALTCDQGFVTNCDPGRSFTDRE